MLSKLKLIQQISGSVHRVRSPARPESRFFLPAILDAVDYFAWFFTNVAVAECVRDPLAPVTVKG